MKKLIIRLSLFTPVIFLIIFFNLRVDPARLFKNKDYEKKISESLIAGRAVTDLVASNFDDRTMNRFLIQSLKHKKDIAVFGSSRAMQISSEMFPGKTLLNNGLSSATLEDFICLYGLYRERRMLPSVIIIGVDPWDFNKNNSRQEWRLWGQYYSKFNHLRSGHQFVSKIRPQDIVSFQLQQLVSVSYFQSGIQFLRSQGFHLLLKKQLFTLTSRKMNEKETLLPDGSRTWSKKQREADPAEVIKYIQRKKDLNAALDMQGYFELDHGLKQQFINLIQTMKNDGVRVVLFLPPYHPFEYDRYVHSDQFRIIKEVESYLKKTSEIYNLTLVGSYDPHQFSIPDTSFADGVHLRDDTELMRIFKPIFQTS